MRGKTSTSSILTTAAVFLIGMADSCDSVEFAKQSSFFFVRNPETTEINSPEENGNIDTRTEDDLKPDDQFDSIPR